MKGKLIAKILIIILTIILMIEILDDYNISKEEEKIKIDILNIQDKINKAKEKDTIYLSEGVFFENITIDKEITIIGNNTILDGGFSGTIVFINADNVKVQNIIIRNSGGYKEDSAIRIHSKNNEIKNCNIYNNRNGLTLFNSKNNKINNCFFHTNGQAIFCRSSEENNISYSQFRNNGFGIFLKNSKDNDVFNSYIYNNGLGFYQKNCENTKIYDSAICYNNQDGGGIWSFHSKNLFVKNSNINHNGAGIKLENTIADISYSNFYFNMFNTLRLINLKDTNISNCNIKNSYRNAVYAEDSNFNFKNNNIIDSGLYGFESKGKTKANLKNNYWNSFLGPSISLYGRGEAISLKPLKNKIFPWKIKEIENIGCSWDVNERFQKKEIKSIESKKNEVRDQDNDYDGLSNKEEIFTDKYGSDPYNKDIFIEVDWTGGNKPSNDYIKIAEDIFKEKEINLHIILDEELPFNDISSAEEFLDIYWDYFLENDINNPKKGIFRYAVAADNIEELYSGFVFMGLDSLDCFGMYIENDLKNQRNYDKSQIIIRTFIHELGHTMGLLIDDFKGIDNIITSKLFSKEWFSYRNYKSCLNYRYLPNHLSYSDGSHGKNDFDDWGNLDFYFFKNTDFTIPE